MARKIACWLSTGLVAVMSVFAAFVYLSGGPQAVQRFAHVGYPQHLRIILGIAKLLGAITLVIPGVVKLKEWAYAGFTFAWISACVAHYWRKMAPWHLCRSYCCCSSPSPQKLVFKLPRVLG
jgi:uncharacterized membrane protein YphA (DoxX/SURF4 family)